MSANYTQNYNLCQWEAQDKVLRTDFNEDNAKIDAALTGLQSRLNTTNTKLNAAYSAENPPVQAGYYTGNGAPSQFIHTGFRPKAVLVISDLREWDFNSNSCSMAAEGVEFSLSFITLGGSGFSVKSGPVGGKHLNGNTANAKYFYIAVR